MSNGMRVLQVLAAVLIMLAAGAAIGDDRAPEFIDCPDTIAAGHCEMVQYQLEATDPKHEHPNNNNIRYQLIEGPGHVDWHSGMWSWSPIDDSVFSGWSEVVVAASIGNSGPHTTPPDDYCRFSVWVGDHSPSMTIEGRDPGAIFFLDAPGTYSYDIDLTDPDVCDTPVLEIVKIEPEPAGTFEIVDDQLQVDLTGDDDETRFIVYFAFVQNERRRTIPYAFDTRDNPMPVFVECPDDLSGQGCGRMRAPVRAEDVDYPGDSRFIDLTVVSGPGEIRHGTWMWQPGAEDIGQTFEVEIAAGYGPFTTSGDDNCRFSVTVEMHDPGLYPVDFSDGDTLDAMVERRKDAIIEVFGEDCRRVSVAIRSITPEPEGMMHLSAASDADGNRLYRVTFVPLENDLGHDFEVVLEGTDGLNDYELSFTFHVVEAEPFVVAVERLDDIALGQEVSLDVNLDGSHEPISDFAFRFIYERGQFVVQDVVPGEALFGTSGCGWEYFHYGPASFGVPGMTGINVRGAMIYPYNPYFVADCLTPETLPAVLFTIETEVSENPTLAGEFLPLEFYWESCNDNALRLRYQNEMISHFEESTYDALGNKLETPEMLPSSAGIPLDCFVIEPGHGLYKSIEFHQGGVQLSSESIPLGGDEDNPDGLPGEFAVRQNYPNPFNAVTVVEFDLPHRSEVTFEVVNLLGQTVYREQTALPAGSHKVEWDGKNGGGEDVASGVYFYRLTTDEFTQTKKMILMK